MKKSYFFTVLKVIFWLFCVSPDFILFLVYIFCLFFYTVDFNRDDQMIKMFKEKRKVSSGFLLVENSSFI